jgi:Family of unknown function (DUF6194)
MDEAALTRYITDTFAGLETASAEGVTVFSYNPDHKPSAGVYFATLKGRDDDHDDVSQLNRPSVFRLSLAITEATYTTRFGPPPPRPGEDGLIETHHDFTALDQLTPHPAYAYLAWVSVLSPGAATTETVRSLLAEAYAQAVSRHGQAPVEGP